MTTTQSPNGPTGEQPVPDPSPSYTELSICASMFRFFGVLGILGGGLVAFSGMFGDDFAPRRGVLGLYVLGVGFVAFAMGAFLSSWRDVAQHV